MNTQANRIGRSIGRTALAAGLALGAIMAAPEVARGAEWSADAVNGASLSGSAPSGMSPAVVKAQVLLDRAHYSPGIIDGYSGGNTSKALRVFQGTKGIQPSGKLDPETWRALTGGSTTAALTTYTVTKEDVAGPFVKSIPADMKAKAKMDALGYTSAKELLSEKFHTHPKLLERLNPGKALDREGTQIIVPNVRDTRPTAKVTSIAVDKKAGMLKAFGEGGRLIAAYPATIGSDDFPAPSGKLKVNGVAENPVFTYSSKLDYAKLKDGETLKIAAGPNNPVGTVWIDLNKRGYGIHGTPDPEKISKTSSHGCVRLTNWDAEELGQLVSVGIPVTFAG